MTLVAIASFAALGGIDSIIEHTVVVSPDKAKNKAFQMKKRERGVRSVSYAKVAVGDSRFPYCPRQGF